MNIPEFETRLRVRYFEVDQMGVVHHSQYVRYFEIARIEWMRSFGLSYKEMEDTGALIVVVKLDVRYRAPARFDDILSVKVTVDKMTKLRIELSYVITRVSDGIRVCEGSTRLACVDRNANLAVLPPSIQALLEKGKAAGKV